MIFPSCQSNLQLFEVLLLPSYRRILSCRDGENRTHISGFGDRCPTVERRPFEAIQLYILEV